MCSGSAPKPKTRADPFGTGVALGEAIRAGGYAAVDLTVRDSGHVLPSQVATHLPLMLNGIRSTGAICDHIGTNFSPPTDPANTAWIASQFVHEILSVAGANGIRKYRFNKPAAVFPGQHVRPDDDGPPRRRPPATSPPGDDQCAVRRSARRRPYPWQQYRQYRRAVCLFDAGHRPETDRHQSRHRPRRDGCTRDRLADHDASLDAVHR